MKGFIRCSQAILIFAGVCLVVVPEEIFPLYYRPQLMALAALVYCVVIELPVFVFRLSRNGRSDDARYVARTQFQVALAIGFLLGGLGSLGLWQLHTVGIPYDKFVHFTFSMLLTIFGANLLRVWHAWSLKKSLLILLALVTSLGAVWECIELLSDRWLNFGYFGSLFDHDSLRDVMINIMGALVGSGILAFWRRRVSVSQ